MVLYLIQPVKAVWKEPLKSWSDVKLPSQTKNCDGHTEATLKKVFSVQRLAIIMATRVAANSRGRKLTFL